METSIKIWLSLSFILSALFLARSVLKPVWPIGRHAPEQAYCFWFVATVTAYRIFQAWGTPRGIVWFVLTLAPAVASGTFVLLSARLDRRFRELEDHMRD